MTTGYPAILLLQDRLAVVIGCGPVGERKVRTLLDAGARVRVVAPSVTPWVRGLARDGALEIVERAYRDGDLDGAAVAVSATGSRPVDEQVSAEAQARGIPLNVVDDVELCSFIAPSIVRRGDLVIAISTGGVNPALAVRIRERLEAEFGAEYARYLELIRSLKERGRPAATPAERAAAWYRVVDSDVLDLVRAGKMDEARSLALALLEGGAGRRSGIVSGSSVEGE